MHISQNSLLLRLCFIAAGMGSAACGHHADASKAAVVYQASERVRSDSSASMTMASSLAVDTHGNIYVADKTMIWVFTADGSELRKIGRQGRGPGEFDAVSFVALIPGDSLYAFDHALGRATVFEPGTVRAAYSVQVGQNQAFFPSRVWRVRQGRSLMGMFMSAYGDFDGRQKGRRLSVLRLMNADGSTQRDSVLSVPEPEHLILHNPEGVAISPFGRTTFLDLTSQDRIVAQWSDSLKFDLYSLEGRHLKTIRASYAPPRRRITDQERDSLVASMANEFVPATSIRRAIDELGATTWPLAQEMFVDEQDRIWVGITGARGEPTHWTAFDDDGARVAQVDLPPNVTLHLLRGTTAYGVMLDENDVPRVVVYDLKPIPTPAPERP